MHCTYSVLILQAIQDMHHAQGREQKSIWHLCKVESRVLHYSPWLFPVPSPGYRVRLYANTWAHLSTEKEKTVPLPGRPCSGDCFATCKACCSMIISDAEGRVHIFNSYNAENCTHCKTAFFCHSTISEQDIHHTACAPGTALPTSSFRYLEGTGIAP